MSRRGSAAAAAAGSTGLWSDAAAGPDTPLRGDDR